MSNEKVSHFFSEPGLVALTFFMTSIAVFCALLFSGFLVSFWLSLPILLFLVGVSAAIYELIPSKSQRSGPVTKAQQAILKERLKEKVIPLLEKSYEANERLQVQGSPEEERQKSEEINKALIQFEKYAQGEISKEEIGIPVESDIYQWLFNSQKAYFMLKLHAEIDYENALEVTTDSEAQNNENEVIFNRLFQRMEETTPIKRPIYSVKNQPDNKFVIFGIKPNGDCLVYCLNIKDRKEMVRLIIEYLDDEILKQSVFSRIADEKLNFFQQRYNDEELDVFVNNKNWHQVANRLKVLINYSDNKTFEELIKKYMLDEKIWFDGPIAKNLCNAINRKDPSKLGEVGSFILVKDHMLKSIDGENKAQASYNLLGDDNHFSRLVDPKNYDEMIRGKIHENKFELFCDQEGYDDYVKSRVRPFKEF